MRKRRIKGNTFGPASDVKVYSPEEIANLQIDLPTISRE
jgi:hypothetical protein